MPLIKVNDIAFGRLQAPDLDAAEAFLVAFGLVRAERTKAALYMRGTDAPHHVHVTEQGEPRLLGLAFQAASEEDLERIAGRDGASPVERIDEPGGGRRVRLTDPDGHRIEVVHGIERLAPLPIRRNVLNWGAERQRRQGEPTRLARGPAQVKRIGHAVLMTTGLQASVGWYRRTLGLVCSDDVYAGPERHVIASFNRCDRGRDYVDHHTVMLVEGAKRGLNHLSFEVQDFDDVMLGHEHLRGLGTYRHMWGIGRHVLGSQIFDYWCDPWGRVHEHWTDTDLFNNEAAPNLISAEDGLHSQWGEPAPQHFIEHATP